METGEILPRLRRVKTMKRNAEFINNIYEVLEKENLNKPVYEIQQGSLKKICADANEE